MIVAFIESYGQTAVQGTSFSPGVDAVLRKGNAALAAGGYSERSAFLTSPTFGGVSWLAHSTLQSGLWVDSPAEVRPRSPQATRFTLSDAFAKAGWRTDQRCAVRHPTVADRELVLPLREPAELEERRLPGAELQLRPHPRPVHLVVLPAARIVEAPQTADGRDRLRLVAYAVDAAAAPGAVVVDRRRLDLRPAAGTRTSAERRLAGSAPRAAALRPVDPVLVEQHSSRSSRRSTTRTSWSSCSATISPPLRSAARVRTTMFRSASSRRTRPSSTASRRGSGSRACSLRPTAPLWRMDAFRDRFLAAYGR